MRFKSPRKNLKHQVVKLTDSRQRHRGFPSVSVAPEIRMTTEIHSKQSDDEDQRQDQRQHSNRGDDNLAAASPGVPDVDIGVHRAGDQNLGLKPGPVQVTEDTHTRTPAHVNERITDSHRC